MGELEFGLRTITNNVLHGLTHKHYNRVVTLADEYKFYSTAEENLVERLKSIREHESENDLEYRAVITHPSNGSLFGQLTRKPDSLVSVNGKKIVLQSESEKNNQELKGIIGSYYANKDTQAYTFSELLPMSYIDPNAWVLVDFAAFDEKQERAKPYPVLLSSKEVVSFELSNGVTKYIIVKKPSTYSYVENDKLKQAEGYNYFMYLPNISIGLTETKDKHNRKVEKDKELDVSILEDDLVYKISGKNYRVKVYEHNTGVIQARRIGYKKDILTNNETLVSFIHPALNNLKEILALSSYRDVMNNKQAFARIFAFAPMCTGEVHDHGTISCNGGQVWDDNIQRNCNSCNGSGVNIPTSEMQGAIYPLPQNPELGLWDLSKMMHIERAPIENLNYFKESIQDVKDRALEAIYSIKSNQSTAGTESYQSRLLDAHEQNRALKPLASNIGELIVFQNDVIARITELNNGLTNIYTFPDNLGFVSSIDLIEVVKLARESNLPTELITPVLEQQAIQEFTNDIEGLAKFNISKEHKPFFAEDPINISLKIDRGLVSKDVQYLHTNFDLILKAIRSKYGYSEFHQLSFDLRENIIKDELEVIKESIETLTSLSIND